MSEPLWQPRSDTGARIAGAGFLFGGVGLIALQIRALRRAVEQGSDALIFAGSVGLGGMGVFMGLYWIFRGLAGYQATRDLRHNPRAKRVIMFATALLVGLALLAAEIWLRKSGSNPDSFSQ